MIFGCSRCCINDQVYTLDKGNTINQPTKSNEKAYRSQGDVVSAFGNQSNLKTIPNQNGFLGAHKYALAGSILGPIGTAIGTGVEILKSHDINNIANEKIYI